MNLGDRWPYVLAIAKARLKHNKTSRHVSQYGDTLEILGVAGELAARRLLGLPEELHTGFDGGKDLVYHGWDIDVKTTRLTNNLIERGFRWPLTKVVRADICLVMAVDVESQRAVALGWCYKVAVERAPIDHEHNCHEVPIVELRPFWQLVVIDLKEERCT
jgi:hypothetical protein